MLRSPIWGLEVSIVPLSFWTILGVQIAHCHASSPTSQSDHTSHNDALKILGV